MSSQTLLGPLIGLLLIGCSERTRCGDKIDPAERVREMPFSGIVFDDRNRNGTRDAGEPGLAGVVVSNGHDVVRTDVAGVYRLPSLDPMIVFVSKPRGFEYPSKDGLRPDFFYIHSSAGAAELRYPGVRATGPLPSSIDFPLYATDATDRFRILAIGDTQPRNHRQLSFLRDSLPESARSVEPVPSFTLFMGDLVHDDLALYPRLIQTLKRIGLPARFVPGNHDLNYDATDDDASLSTYSRLFGPPYYSFDHGRAHFVVLDTVYKTGNTPRSYRGELDPEQLRWLAKDLEMVDQETLIVLAMHIPLVSWVESNNSDRRTQVCNRGALYSLLDGRKVLALAGHTHTVEHFTPGQWEEGWDQKLPFTQITVGASCGSWWNGPIQPNGVPQALQRDGAPKGYFIIDFDGTEFRPRYRPSTEEDTGVWLSVAGEDGRLLEDGVIDRDDRVKAVANLWAAPPDTQVSFEVDGKTLEGTRDTQSADPLVRAMQKTMPEHLQMKNSAHLWSVSLPALTPGHHPLVLDAKDRYQNTYRAQIRLEVRHSETQGRSSK